MTAFKKKSLAGSSPSCGQPSVRRSPTPPTVGKPLLPLGAMLLAGTLVPAALAQQPQSGESAATLEAVTVTGEVIKAHPAQSPKFMAAPVDTPKTINIVPREVIEQQNAQTLQEVLSNVPGITFASGEGGGGWGDMFTIRGFSGDQSVTVDGVRQGVLSQRNDTFNMEQAEVLKGTGTVESGVAAVGGSVNLVTKVPEPYNFSNLSVGLGTADYHRATADINRTFGDSGAVRLSVMRQANKIAKRKPSSYDRWGFAPSVAWGLNTPTRITGSYFYQNDDNMPDWGIPTDANGKRLRGISRDYWASYDNLNAEKTKTNTGMLLLEHDINKDVTISNRTALSEVKRLTHLTTGGRMLNLPRGMENEYQAGDLLPAGSINRNYFYGYDISDNLTYPSGYLGVARLHDFVNSYKGKTFSNQTDLNAKFSTGSVKHRLATGFEFYSESYRKRPWSRMQGVGGNSGRPMVVDVRNPLHSYTGPLTRTEGGDRSGAKITDWSLYVHDHVSFNRHWEFAGGLRYDRFRVNWYDAAGDKRDYKQTENAFSGSLSAIYKPVENGSVYVTYSQAQQPSAAAAASRSGGGGNANVSHYSMGKAKTIELGTKWDLLDNQRLALTGAVFQVERNNPEDIDPDDPNKIIQGAAKERVRGIEVGLSGQITPKWSLYGGATVLNGKIKGHADPLQIGGKLKNVPNATFNIWTAYQLTPQWDMGLGAQYVGKRRFYAGNTIVSNFTGNHYSADTYMPNYWLFNATVGYRINDKFRLRMNLDNIFNKFYASKGTASRLGLQKYIIPGPGRTATLTLDMSF